MGIDLDSFVNSRMGMSVALGIGRAIPPRTAQRLANMVAHRMTARGEADIVRAVRLNQWVASGGVLDADGLDVAVEKALAHSIRVQYDLFRHYRDVDALLDLVEVDQSMQAVLDRIESGEGPTIVVGPHLGNFDLCLHALGHGGLRVQILSVPGPNEGYRWQNEQRESAGLTLTPMSKGALSNALERLRGGGAVGTGIDRPIEGHKYRPRFFGRPASLPVAHVHLALKTDAHVYVMGTNLEDDGGYRVHAVGPIRMERADDPLEETVSNAERLLAVAEKMILDHPRQWTMFYPVWPEVQEDVP